jgi:biofilm PGA synthesis protein PgaA
MVLSKYYSLVYSGNYTAAAKILDELDTITPLRKKENGKTQDNWDKEEIAVIRAWHLLYQDCLPGAQDYVQNLLNRAPFNTNLRTALAHTYLWRGWNRKALKEFNIINSINPDEISSGIGYCYALLANARNKKAIQLANKYSKKFPTHKEIRNLNKYLKLLNSRKISIESGITKENPGIHNAYQSIKIEQPFAYKNKFFIETTLQEITQDKEKLNEKFGTVGFDFQINRSLELYGSLTRQGNSSKLEYSGSITLIPNDFFSIAYIHNSHSLSLGPRTQVQGIFAKENSVNLTYRSSEQFSIETEASTYNMSDKNKQLSYTLVFDNALITKAYWKTFVRLENNLTTNSKTETEYFSPAYTSNVYITPRISHTWHKLNKRIFSHTLTIGFGAQKQKDFEFQDVYYISYDQSYVFSDVLELLIETTYSLENYDGEDSSSLDFNVGMSTKF